MNDRIVSIIKQLPILDNLKEALIENIDFINKEQLVEILSKYSESIKSVSLDEKQKILNINKNILSYEMVLDKQLEEKEVGEILSKLDNNY